MRLAGRIALVTGAARGIGAAIARRFAAEGATVVVGDIDTDRAAATAAAIRDAGGTARAVRLDVTRAQDAKDVVAEIVARDGRLDILVNNAGVVDRAAFLDLSVENFETVLRVNLVGALVCGQAAARAMIAGGGGRIVNLASISGQRAGSGRAAYGASKAAIINLTGVMALELGPHGIVVNAIAPGPTDVGRRNTPEQQQATFSRMAIGRFAMPEEIAAAAVFLASDECTMTTGHVLNVDGGFNAIGIAYPASVPV
jgi:3-oxoacyl-[acyl-carrier protein] reductase